MPTWPPHGLQAHQPPPTHRRSSSSSVCAWIDPSESPNRGADPSSRAREATCPLPPEAMAGRRRRWRDAGGDGRTQVHPQTFGGWNTQTGSVGHTPRRSVALEAIGIIEPCQDVQFDPNLAPNLHDLSNCPDAHGPSYGGVWGLKPLGFEGPRAVWSVWVTRFSEFNLFSAPTERWTIHA